MFKKLSRSIMSQVKNEDLESANQEAKDYPFRVEFFILGRAELDFLIPEEIRSFSESQSLITLSALPHTDTLGYKIKNFSF